MSYVSMSNNKNYVFGHQLQKFYIWDRSLKSNTKPIDLQSDCVFTQDDRILVCNDTQLSLHDIKVCI